MILTEFDYEKNAIINPWHTSDVVQGMPKVAVTCFSRVTFARMLSAFGGERIASTNVANMEIPVYKTVYHTTHKDTSTQRAVARTTFRQNSTSLSDNCKKFLGFPTLFL